MGSLRCSINWIKFRNSF